MAVTKTITKIPGTGQGGGIRMVTDMVTLSSGQGTFKHGLRKCRIICTPTHATAVPAEGIGPLSSPNADGWIIESDGQTTIDSSNASSALKVFCVAYGYGA